MTGARDKSELPLGTRLRSWIIDEYIATGGFGDVYRVHHRDTGQIGALKLLRADLVSSSEMLARFEREAETIAMLHHPNVVELLDLGHLADGRPFLVMEYLDGIDLDDHLASIGALSLEQALPLLTPLTAALTAAHERGIIHRDVKASNVMLVGDGAERRVVLLDFGVAKLLEAEGPALTHSRARLGTPAAMAPEQSSGDAVDARTDVYALGALAFHILTGAPPFGSETPLVAEYMHLRAERPRPSDVVTVPSAIDDVITKAMAIARDERFDGPAEFLAAFEDAVVPEVPTAEREEVWERAFGLYVHVWADDGAFEDGDDAIFDDAESLLPRALPALEASGMVEASRAGNSALVFRKLSSDDDAALAQRLELVGAARELVALLDQRAGREPAVHFGLYLHVDAAVVDRGVLVGGPLRALAGWAHECPVEGVFATEGVLAGLEVDAVRVSDDPPLWRVG